MTKLILASASPRRIEMFKNAGYDPVVMPASIIEEISPGASPAEATMSLAMQKAMAVRDSYLASEGVLSDDTVIVAADTVVVLDGQIIGKPLDENEAFATLSSMRSRSHHVITGCCILRSLGLRNSGCTSHQAAPSVCETAPSDWETISFYEDTEVWFKDFTDRELLDYVKTSEPYDKAGGYAIQGTFGKYVDHIEGDFDNVVGLPFSRVESYLK
ncbi:MAG: Maf family protein [Bacillota bacterium]|nr:Maf family protein [Bacillota bacterium]